MRPPAAAPITAPTGPPAAAPTASPVTMPMFSDLALLLGPASVPAQTGVPARQAAAARPQRRVLELCVIMLPPLVGGSVRRNRKGSGTRDISARARAAPMMQRRQGTVRFVAEDGGGRRAGALRYTAH